MVLPPAERIASVAQLQHWRQNGLLDAGVVRLLMQRLRSVQSWRDWGSRSFLFIGGALLLSGIVFFFAWNWSGMSRSARLGVALAGIALPACGFLLPGVADLVRRILLLASCVMIGVFLAVFGQEYQTGADHYLLFVAWAALALPWVIAADFAPLVVLWLGIAATGAGLWWLQDGASESVFDTAWQGLFFSVAAVHGAALVLKEAAAERFEALRPQWLRLWLVVVILLPLCGVVCCWVALSFFSGGAGLSLLWGVAAAAVFWEYRFRQPDPAAVAVAVMSAGAVVVALAGRWLWAVFFAPQVAGWAVPGVIVYGLAISSLIAAVLWLLRKIARQMHDERQGLESEAGAGREPRAGEPAQSADRSAGPSVQTWRSVISSLPLAEDEKAAIAGRIASLTGRWREPPWLKAAAALGGWAAALCIMPVLLWVVLLVLGVRERAGLSAAGGVLLGICTVLSRQLPESAFLRQLNLATALVAVWLLVAGVMSGGETSAFTTVTLVLVCAAVVTYPFFEDAAFRFLIVAFCLASLSLRLAAEGGVHGPPYSMLIALLAVSTGALWGWMERPRLLNPLAQAAALGLAGVITFAEFSGQIFDGRQEQTALRFELWALAASAVALVCALNRGVRSLFSRWGLGLTAGCAALAAGGQTGVLAGVLMAVAAFAWGDALLGLAAWLFVAFCIWTGYYSLAVPLFWKAVCIGGTGLLLLAARAFVRGDERSGEVL